MRLTVAEFLDRWDGLFTRAAFRLETLPFYVSDEEAEPFARWLRGEPDDLGWKDPWRRILRDARVAGKEVKRVHVVREPLSEYLQFELSVVYPEGVKAGEDIRILVSDRSLHPDFWLLDDTACLMNYDQAGNWLGVDLLTDAAEVSRFKTWRDDLLRHSIPLAEYGQPARRTA